MAPRKEDEIMAGYLLKGGKMLEKTCKTCGCPLFEVKGKTLCVVCAENETEKGAEKKPAAAAPPAAGHVHSTTCGCGVDHDAEPCTCGDEEGGLLFEELAMTIHALCERIHNEKDPENVLSLMQAVKAGTEALEILCRL
ncbi:Sjogren's syndrome/scleroderma autoantigen 1 family protein [Methanoregula formicica]|uniref:Putative Zn-finger containing protein n=1 Tax=Methanoregula formicica (strain DSM 22288 / NBRC 105244 / SMSP) TaxID=593750 RepID=L0HET5_METFS|nr:Sjogren's syndrome/scleroderma autoantigen 1 family protein [Methanoregula formicica]AGB03227.1 putative Zn-finger containing protein [Methanoregula formicica SMSP]